MFPASSSAEAVQSLPLFGIEDSPFWKRHALGNIEELAASIRARGVVQPVVVRERKGRWEVVVGHRRVHAGRLADLEVIPAIVREMGDDEVVAAQLVENCQRRDIHPLEEAEAYKKLRDDHGWSTQRIAQEVGKALSTVLARLKLNELAPEPWEALVDEKLTTSVALLIARIPAPDLQAKATREVLRQGAPGASPMGWTEAAEHIRRGYMMTPIGDTMKPAELFDCVLLRCTLTAAACVRRQDARRRVGPGLTAPVYRPCGEGKCSQGAQVRTALGDLAPSSPALESISKQPRAAPTITAQQVTVAELAADTPAESLQAETERAIEAAAVLPSLLPLQVLGEPPAEDDAPALTDAEPQRAQRLKRPSRQTQAWLRFTAEHQLEDVLDDPAFWGKAVVELADERLPFETAGQKVAACLSAGMHLAVREGLGRSEVLRLANSFFDSFKAAQADQEAA